MPLHNSRARRASRGASPGGPGRRPSKGVAPYQGGKAGERVPAGIILLGGHHGDGENAVGVMDSWCPASWYRFYVRYGVPISKKR